MKTIRRLLLLALGLLLIPFCIAATQALIALLQMIQPSSYAAIPRSGWALAIGVGLWLCLYFAMPRPVRTYVFAHELTHALWGYLMGASVSRMKLSKSGGSVVLSKNNIFITLAPYFFPFYTIIVIGGYYALSLFVDLSSYELFWLALVGLTWGFHATFTISTLMQHQSDIREYGHVLSYAIIYMFNVLGIGLWVVIVSSAGLEQFVTALVDAVNSIWRLIVAAVPAAL